jgi:hypothetical protein
MIAPVDRHVHAEEGGEHATVAPVVLLGAVAIAPEHGARPAGLTGNDSGFVVY